MYRTSNVLNPCKSKETKRASIRLIILHVTGLYAFGIYDLEALGKLISRVYNNYYKINYSDSVRCNYDAMIIVTCKALVADDAYHG